MRVPVSDQQTQPVLRNLNRTRRFATSRTVVALMLREMSTSYGRTPIGYLWAILQPVGGIVILTLVFSVFLRVPPLGQSFALFYATGFLPFVLYNEISSKLAMAIPHSKGLLSYPSVTVLDALVARFLLNFLTQLLVAFIVFAGLLVFFETQAGIDLPAIAMAFVMIALISIGVGTLNAFLFGMIPSWVRFWAIFNRPLFLLSGALFLYDDIPLPYRDYLWYNPLVHVVGQMRRGFYPFYEAEYVSISYTIGVSLVLLLLGLIFLRRFALDILHD